ncbi:AraC family transcriptional regulator [Ahniella affigens]|nr:AraC family transcriptional regulator [Ahniella affigens]
MRRSTRLTRLPTLSPESGSALYALYLRPISQQIEYSGVSLASCLDAVGLPLNLLDHEAPIISARQFLGLLREGMTRADEPALGLLIGQRLLPETHGLLSLAAMQSGSLRETVAILEAFLALRTQLVGFRVVTRGQRVMLEIRESHPLGALSTPVLEAILLAIKNLLDAVAMGETGVIAVHCPFPAPPYDALAQDLFSCPVRYRSRTAALVLDAAVLDRPLRAAQRDAFSAATAACQSALQILAETQSVSADVQRLLIASRGRFPSWAACARLLHKSPRSLHRHLQAEGSSYRGLMDQVRMQFALDHLQSGRFTVAQTAMMLGYTDLANFRRAFKRWRGQTPASVRPHPGKRTV